MDTAVHIRFWTRLLTLPHVWIPAAIATPLALSGYGFGVWGYVVSGLGIAAALAFQAKPLWQLAEEDVRAETDYIHQSALRSLRRRLREDNDDRSSRCIRELAQLYDRIRTDDLLKHHHLDAPVTTEVKSQCQQLYDTSFESLERTYLLWQASKQMASTEKSTSVLDARERLLTDIAQSINNLAHTLDFLQAAKLEADEANQRSIRETRQELEHGLKVARAVHSRLNELEEEFRIDNNTQIP